MQSESREARISMLRDMADNIRNTIPPVRQDSHVAPGGEHCEEQTSLRGKKSQLTVGDMACSIVDIIQSGRRGSNAASLSDAIPHLRVELTNLQCTEAHTTVGHCS